MYKIKLRAKKYGRYYKLEKLIDNEVVATIDHNFKTQLDCIIYGNKLDNPLYENPKTIYRWVSEKRGCNEPRKEIAT